MSGSAIASAMALLVLTLPGVLLCFTAARIGHFYQRKFGEQCWSSLFQASGILALIGSVLAVFIPMASSVTLTASGGLLAVGVARMWKLMLGTRR